MVKKILVVDDEDDVREAVKDVLINADFNVKTASSGGEALAILRKNIDFDLVLMDFFMPKLSGIELLEIIKKDLKLKHLKCAFLTIVDFSKQELDKLMQLSVLDHIKKPFNNEDLINRIERMIK